MPKHPLVVWLKAKKQSLPEFAKESEIGRMTLYDLVAGRYDNPSLRTLWKIEFVTKGEVSMKAMLDWLAAREAL